MSTINTVINLEPPPFKLNELKKLNFYSYYLTFCKLFCSSFREKSKKGIEFFAFATNSNFLIFISFQLDGVRYFKLRQFDQKYFIDLYIDWKDIGLENNKSGYVKLFFNNSSYTLLFN